MTLEQKSEFLEELDAIAVSEEHVRRVTGQSRAEIRKAMAKGEFPLPVLVHSGMKYWRLGDMARLELGWA